MEEYIHSTQLPQLSAIENRRHNSRTQKEVNPELCIPFTVPDLVYKFQMIWGTEFILGGNQMWDIHMDVNVGKTYNT
jgi:hypothetical protein